MILVFIFGAVNLLVEFFKGFFFINGVLSVIIGDKLGSGLVIGGHFGGFVDGENFFVDFLHG